jgi:Ni,Fe-hydrogenase III large subunit
MFRSAVIDRVADGWRVAALFGVEGGDGGPVDLWAVLADDEESRLAVARSRLEGDGYQALTPDCPQAHLFEREIAEQLGVVPDGHPRLNPVRFRRSSRAGHDAWERPDGEAIEPGVEPFLRVDGEEVHEVAVGPVHAGVIEPGHFRFQCHGEEVFHLEIALGYQHRGVEEALKGGPCRGTLAIVETIAGDTTIAHTVAHAQVVEALGGVTAPGRAQALRGIALELERIANHVGDLGALAGDVAYLPTQSFCGRIRGDVLNLTAAICGSRFGRGLVRPGGVAFDLSAAEAEEIADRLSRAVRELDGAVKLMMETPSVVARFEGTGRVSREACYEMGFVGPTARACGQEIDVRRDHPAGIYAFAQVPVVTAHHGDVNSRVVVRWLESQHSAVFVRDRLASLPEGPIRGKVGSLAPDRFAVALVEGWRGEVCHVAITDSGGRFAKYKVVDPSFHDWFALELALRGTAISDFPLCNKSFNLSYCGHDL